MTILKRFFNKVDPQKTFDTVASGIDKVFFTKEEQAEAKAKAFEQWLEWYRLATEENTARSITRRYLAILFAGVFLFLILAAAGIWYFNVEYAAFLWELAKTLAPYVGGIMLFYFGYYGIKSVVKTAKN